MAGQYREASPIMKEKHTRMSLAGALIKSIIIIHNVIAIEIPDVGSGLFRVILPEATASSLIIFMGNGSSPMRWEP